MDLAQHRTPLRVLASVLGGLAAIMVVAAIGLSVQAGWSWRDALEAFVVSNAAMGVAFAGCGAILAWHRPRNPIGWLFLAGGLCQSTAAMAAPLGAVLLEGGASIPLLRLNETVFAWSWPWAIGLCIPLALLLFPDGRPPTPRWRPVIIAVIVTAPLFNLEMAAAPGPMEAGLSGGLSDAAVLRRAAAAVAAHRAARPGRDPAGPGRTGRPLPSRHRCRPAPAVVAGAGRADHARRHHSLGSGRGHADRRAARHRPDPGGRDRGDHPAPVAGHPAGGLPRPVLGTAVAGRAGRLRRAGGAAGPSGRGPAGPVRVGDRDSGPGRRSGAASAATTGRPGDVRGPGQSGQCRLGGGLPAGHCGHRSGPGPRRGPDRVCDCRMPPWSATTPCWPATASARSGATSGP